jgi:histone H3/H4
MGLIKKNNIRDVLDGMNLGEDLVMELERKVDEILKKAVERARKNFRRTVYARDL